MTSVAIALGRRGDDHLPRPGHQVPLRLLDIREQARGFDDHLHPQLFPRQLRRLFGAHHHHLLPVDHQHVMLRLVRRRLLRADAPLKPALRRVVLEQISQVVRRHDVPYRHHLNLLAHQTLLDHRPVHQAANPAEPIDCDFHFHISIQFRFSSLQFSNQV